MARSMHERQTTPPPQQKICVIPGYDMIDVAKGEVCPLPWYCNTAILIIVGQMEGGGGIPSTPPFLALGVRKIEK